LFSFSLSLSLSFQHMAISHCNYLTQMLQFWYPPAKNFLPNSLWFTAVWNDEYHQQLGLDSSLQSGCSS
jgi:hypothetical protein